METKQIPTSMSSAPMVDDLPFTTNVKLILQSWGIDSFPPGVRLLEREGHSPQDITRIVINWWCFCSETPLRKLAFDYVGQLLMMGVKAESSDECAMAIATTYNKWLGVRS